MFLKSSQYPVCGIYASAVEHSFKIYDFIRTSMNNCRRPSVRIQVPGFACRPSALPAGRYGAAVFGSEVGYFLTAAMRLNENDEPDVRFVILNRIGEPRILPFTSFPVRMLGNRPTLLFSADAFIKINPQSIELPQHRYAQGVISVYGEFTYLSTSDGQVNLTTGEFGDPTPGDMHVSFRHWSLYLPDGDKVTELFTFEQL